MSILNLYPARVRFVNPDGTLTVEASRMLAVLVGRVGGTMGDSGMEIFAQPEAPDNPAMLATVMQPPPAVMALPDVVMQPALPAPEPGELAVQPVVYRPGTALQLTDFAFALKDTAVAPGMYGDAKTVPKYQVDQQGRLILAESVPIAITASQVSDLGSMALQNVGTNFTGSFTGKTVTVSNGIITSVV